MDTGPPENGAPAAETLPDVIVLSTVILNVLLDEDPTSVSPKSSVPGALKS